MIRRGAGWLARAAFALCLPSVTAAQALPAPAAVEPASLAQQLEAIAAVPAGRGGIAAIDLATGREVAVHGKENFPLASVIKIAVAAAYYRKSTQAAARWPNRSPSTNQSAAGRTGSAN